MAAELGLNVFDLIVIGGVLFSSVFAFIRGFMREVLSLAAWIASILAVFYLAPPWGAWLGGQVEAQWGYELQPWLEIGLAGLLIFLAVMVAGSLINASLWRAIRSLRLSFADRALGFLFGAVRGMAVIVVCYFLYGRLVAEANFPPWLAEARTRPALELGVNLLLAAVRPFLPDETTPLLPPEPGAGENVS